VVPSLQKKAAMPGKERVDVLIVERGLAPSRERAQALLMAGQIRVDDQPVTKAGTRIATEAKIELVGGALRYASRGGLKLEGALEDLGVDPTGRICLDVGSSTGGFTDCLLQRGAVRVHAVDVTIGQLDWKLRQDPRVRTVERNARNLVAADIGEPVDLVVIDVSFISVAKILPAVVAAAGPAAEYLILVKPQFELEKSAVGKGGIVKDETARQAAVDQVKAAATARKLEVLGVQPSRIRGRQGNQEFFLHARRQGVE
jgi:23S rRNA (cytidine1920-2'-O)/16S rRNA (cytidine1409-2'-O)-methyltransferase